MEWLIAGFVERYGAERLLFGSGFPDNAAGAVLYARIGEEDKANILHRNAEELVAAAPPASFP